MSVRIREQKDLAASCRCSCVARPLFPEPPLGQWRVVHNSEAGIAPRRIARGSRGIVSGAVVDNDELEARIRRGENGSNAALDVVRFVARGNYYGNERRVRRR
jgi:hypothetical protein